MEFEVASKKAGDFGVSALMEGGAVTIGLFAAGFTGKRVENLVKKGVVKSSPIMDKLIAYGANNIPKAALWWLTKEYFEPKTGSTTDVAKAMVADARKGMVTSIALDTFGRATNDLAPKPFKLFGIDILSGESTPDNATGDSSQLRANLQRMVQENSNLRNQLTQAMTKLASAPSVAELAPPADHDRRFGMMQTTPQGEDRRKDFGAMTAPIEAERNRRYGAMNKSKMNFAGEADSVSAQFGML